MKHLILLFTVILSSCIDSQVKTPIDPMWERENCAHCRMTLSEKRYAAQRIMENGEIHYYDDLNCALNHRGTSHSGKLYVRPYPGEKWISAEDARFQAGLRTPMGSGFGAVAENGPISFQDIKNKLKEK